MSITEITQAAHDAFVRDVQGGLSPVSKIIGDVKALLEKAAKITNETAATERAVLVAEVQKAEAAIHAECDLLLAGLKASLDKFHVHANKVDAFIQQELPKAEATVKAAEELAKAEQAKVEAAANEAI